MKLKLYRYAIIVVTSLLILLNLFFIVRTIILMIGQEGLSDYIIILVCLVMLLVILIMHIVNTFVSMKAGSTFIKPLAFDDDATKNTKFIIFCYVFGAISLGVIVYFILILSGMELYFSHFIKPVSFLIVNLFSVTLTDAIFIILFPYLGKEDLAFSKNNRKK